MKSTQQITTEQITREQAEKVATSITDKLINYNLLLYKLEANEQYEQCSMVNTALQIFIHNSAIELSYFSDMPTQQIFEQLLVQSKMILENIKDENPNPEDITIDISL